MCSSAPNSNLKASTMAAATTLNLPKLSHDALKHKIESVEAYQMQHFQKMELERRMILASLIDPTTKTDKVGIGAGMIIVSGTEGQYTYDFDIPETASDICYLEITYASGDVRKLVLTLNGRPLGGDFCEETTGGFSADNYKSIRYGPFNLNIGKNILHCTTNRYWFPHVHEVKVLDAVVVDQEAALNGRATTRSLQPTPERTWIAPPSQPLRKE